MKAKSNMPTAGFLATLTKSPKSGAKRQKYGKIIKGPLKSEK